MFSRRMQSKKIQIVLISTLGFGVLYFTNSMSRQLPKFGNNNNLNFSTALPLSQELISNNELRGVACDSSGQRCVAVGSYFSIIRGGSTPLSFYTTDGGDNWTVSNTMPPPQGSGGNNLFSVACSSSGQYCAAVGDYLPRGHISDTNRPAPLTFYTTDGGNNWIVSTTLPPPQGQGEYHEGQYNDNSLQDIACDSSGQHCIAAGTYFSTIRGDSTPLSFYTTDGGNTWTISKTLPPPQGSSHNILYSIACDSSGERCTAVGYYNNGRTGTDVPLSFYTTNGGDNWMVSNTMPPSHSVSYNELYRIACDSFGQHCTTVGHYDGGCISNSAPLSFYTTDSGNNWTVSAILLLPHQGSLYNELYSIACDFSGQRCITVGGYAGGFAAPLNSYTTDGGNTWAVAATMPLPQGSRTSVLYDIACDSYAQHCTAVGIYYPSETSSAYVPLSFYTTDGGNTWAISKTLPPPQGSRDNKLYAVTGGAK